MTFGQKVAIDEVRPVAQISAISLTFLGTETAKLVGEQQKSQYVLSTGLLAVLSC